MLKWNKEIVPESLLDEIKKIPGAYYKEKGEEYRHGLYASNDLKIIITNMLHANPSWVKSETKNIKPSSPLPSILFPWQKEASVKLAKNEKRFLWHFCGSGKSLTVLSACSLMGASKVLIITRSMGKDVYARDLIKINDNRHVAILMGLKGEGKGLEYGLRKYNKYLEARGFFASAYKEVPQNAYITVCPWEILHAHVEDLLKIQWDVIIFDEHHLGKGRLAKRTEAALEISKKAEIKWSLTATPVRDRLKDLWAQWKCIDEWSAGSSWNWMIRYCNMHENRWGGMDANGTSNLDELQERLSVLADIKTRKEVMHLLPGKMRNMIRLDEKISEKHFDYSQRGIESAIATAANLKIDEVVERCIESLLGREKIVLTGNRRLWVPTVYEKIKNTLPNSIKDKAWIKWTTGENNVGDRQELANEYMKMPEMSLLIATSDSISESIDLQDTDRLIVAALPYTPGQLVQLEGRVSRLGGSRPVTIDYLIAENTIDEQIEDSLLNKLDAIESVGANTEVSMGIGKIDEEKVIEDLNKWLKENAKR